ncbi:MAG: AAA family ATPase [Cyanobacteria bacterium RUI128]|nr:AAA family ATPase [Cyanobacteria bacterium RUI128]
MGDENQNEGINNLIAKEVNSHDKIFKPDFSQKTGRELLAFYLQTKFKQALAYDKKAKKSVIVEIKDDFINRFTRRLINNPNKRILIGITGESASGKSTICQEISNFISRFNQPVAIVRTDNYFNDISELIKRYGSFDALRDNGYDIDSPNNFQLDILRADLEAISRGEDIDIPRYLLNGTGISVPKSMHIQSNKIIIVEGVATMYETIQDIFDIKIFVETDEEIRKERFMSRAVNARNQSLENALKHWEYIQDAGKKYITPSRPYMDIILNGDCNLPYFTQILEYLYTITNNFEQE